MKLLSAIMVTILVCLTASSDVQARTLEVSPSGDAEFVSIQAAITSADVGDTILLWAGRYLDSFEWSYNNDAWTEPVFAAVNVDSLVIKGVARDQVIIGPETPAFVDFGPKGVVVEPSVSAFWLENLTLENVYDGVYTAASGGIVNCSAIGCRIGVLSISCNNLEIRGCSFLSGFVGIAAVEGTTGLVVDDCLIRPVDSGIRFVGAANCMVTSSRIEAGLVGTVLEAGSSAEFVSCVFAGVANSAVYLSHSQIVLNDTVLGQSYRPFWAVGVCSLRGEGCIVGPGEVETMRFQSSINIDFSGNDIFVGPGGKTILALPPAIPGSYNLNMANNYWGTADPDSIAELIWDGSDDPGIDGVVEFLPAASDPVPVRSESLGSVKSMFR